MAETVRWGILGCGRIARRFASSLKNQADSILYAAAGRNPEHLKAFALECSPKKTMPSFEELLFDPNVDAVYIALPHALHKEWSIKAIQAGKAVRCEKPAVCSEQEMLQIIQAANEQQVLFMEAMKTRFVPAYRRLCEEIFEKDRIGPIQKIQVSQCSDFGQKNLGDPTKYYNQPGQGGGLLDGGCYALNYFSEFLPYDFEVIQADGIARYGIDHYLHAVLDFDGITGEITSAMDRTLPKTAIITGKKGIITIDNLHRPEHLHLETASGKEDIFLPYDYDDFYSQIDAFVKTYQAKEIENESMPWTASLQNARLSDAILKKFHESIENSDE